MKIAVASGKGGTGKTTVSLSLAAYLAMNGEHVTYVDCDVEEPNGHLFLHPSIERIKPVTIPIPVLDTTRCDGCGKCAEICRFSAIIAIPDKVLIFPELCKGCGGCRLVCPTDAIREIPNPIGVIESGIADGIKFIAGRLNIGQASAVPIIREIRHIFPDNENLILDAPPGTSCPVIETIKGSDVVVLVSEPTPFGLHDLHLASKMVGQMGIPQVIVLNRSGQNNDLIYRFCDDENLNLIAEIPDDRRIAETYSRGEIMIQALPETARHFRKIFESIQCELRK